MGLGFTDYIKVNQNTMNHFFEYLQRLSNTIEYRKSVADYKRCCPKYIISWETIISSRSKENCHGLDRNKSQI